jgi:hypothetical protein
MCVLCINLNYIQHLTTTGSVIVNAKYLPDLDFTLYSYIYWHISINEKLSIIGKKAGIQTPRTSR